MRREISFDHSIEIMPEHAGFVSRRLSREMGRACSEFLRGREVKTMGMREIVHEGAEEGKRRKARRMKSGEG